jgi:hypothetical protein
VILRFLGGVPRGGVEEGAHYCVFGGGLEFCSYVKLWAVCLCGAL